MIFCEKCRTYPITMRCPEKPHERCEWCWRLWFNEGTKARARRVRRLAKAAVQRYRRHVRDFPQRMNRRERRRGWRTGMEWRAADLGLTPLPGEPTKALFARVLDASDEAWLNRPLTPAEQEAFDAADDGECEPW